MFCSLAYLIKKCNMNYEEAFKFLSSKRNIQPNKGFIEQLKSII